MIQKAIFPVTPAALDADSQQLRTCCSGCRFSAPAHVLLSMPFLSTCALAALDADFQELLMPIFSTLLLCALAALDADFQQLRT